MNEILTLTNERVDDIPVLLTQMERMGLQPLLDEYFPTHGNWQGLSLGWVVDIWLTHILSEGDHRLNQVQDWVKKHRDTLRICTGQLVTALDFTDDRLEIVLRILHNPAQWELFETALNGRLLRVYDLQSGDRVRVDSTSASGYWQVTEDGLFQFGHSKDHRPDLPQVKVTLATLDPLGLPLVTDLCSGERADDPVYVPAIRRVQTNLHRHGVLYVGDSKMGSHETRAFIHKSEDDYLCPLSATQLPTETLMSYLEEVWTGRQTLIPIEREGQNGKPEKIAEGYERSGQQTGVVDNQEVSWHERCLVVRSLSQAKAMEIALQARLVKAQAEMVELNRHERGKRRFSDVESLRQATEAIVKQYRLVGLLQLSYDEQVTKRPIRHYRDRPAEIREERAVSVVATVDQVGLAAAIRQLGWRAYATNATPERLSLAQAVLAYRSEYIIEHDFGRLKGKALSLTPMYLQTEAYIEGLIRLLTIGLRVLTLVEFTVRRQLAKAQEKLAGLYAGNPKRATAQPTTEQLLAAFKDITLTVLHEADQTQYHITPLSDLQQRILKLLDFPVGIYTRICVNSVKPPYEMGEP